MRTTFIIILLSISVLLGGQIDPYLRHLNSTLLQKATVEDLHVLVRGDQGFTNDLKQAGFRVQSDFGKWATVIVPSDRLNDLLDIKSVQRVSMSPKAKLHNSLAVPYQNVDSAYDKGYTGSDVLVGVIDTGIDFYHRMFRKQDGSTRVLYLWDQTLSGTGPSGSDYKYGIEYNSTQINQDINSGVPNSIVKQEDTQGHGTHVAGSMAGYDYTISPPDTLHGGAIHSNMIIVKTTLEGPKILEAVEYIFAKAAALGKPCVINMSLGSQYGPHDGSDDEAQAINSQTGAGKIIVRSAGNNGGDYIHYYKETVVASEQIKFGYPGYMNLWIEKGDNLQSVKLSWSKGSSSNVPQNGEWKNDKIFVYLVSPLANANGQIAAKIFIEDTTLKSETFTLTLNNLSDGNSNGKIARHAWTENSAFLSPYGGFSQGSKYSTLHYPYTLSNEACAESVITVGAFISRETWKASDGNSYHYENSGDDGGIANFSSVGPTANNKEKPDIIAGGTLILSARSEDATYSIYFLPPSPYTNNYGYMQGTSMASPVAAGAIALILERNPSWTPDDMRQYLKTNAKGSTSPDGWNSDQLKVKSNPGVWERVFGYGAVDVTKAVSGNFPDPDEGVVEGYYLGQNYPNPFNPKTVISYQLSVVSEVELGIYNTLGQKVATLVFGKQPAGQYDVEWNATDFASGVYFYRLKTDHFSKTRKMALIR